MKRAAIVFLAVFGLIVTSITALQARGRRSPETRTQARPIVLRVANWAGPSVDPSFVTVEREIKEAFERKRPDVSVRIENIPGPTSQCYVPKLLMMYVAGTAPDVITLDASSAAVFIDNSLLADLKPFAMNDSQLRLEDYFPNALDIARRGERLYAIPLDFTPMVMLYNRRMFDDANVPYPRDGWTRDEFLAAAKALTVREPGRPTARRYGFNFQKDMSLWFPWIWAGGGDVLSGDGQHAAGYFDGSATVETIQFLADLVKKHRVAPSFAESSAAGVDLFRAGRAAITMTGHWSLIEYRVDNMDLGVASIPSKTGQRVTVMYESGLAISASSRNKLAAWDYIRHMTSSAVQRKRVAGGLAISGNRRAAMSFAGEPVEDAFLREVQYARRPWGAACERYELVEDLGREMIEDIINGDVPVAQAAQRTAWLIDAELRRQ